MISLVRKKACQRTRVEQMKVVFVKLFWHFEFLFCFRLPQIRFLGFDSDLTFLTYFSEQEGGGQRKRGGG